MSEENWCGKLLKVVRLNQRPIFASIYRCRRLAETGRYFAENMKCQTEESIKNNSLAGAEFISVYASQVCADE